MVIDLNLEQYFYSYLEEGWYDRSHFYCMCPSSQEAGNTFKYGIMKSKRAHLIQQDLMVYHVEGLLV